MDLQGKVAIVTGASRGIGEACARELAQRGAAVVVASRKIEALEPVAKSIRDSGGRAIAFACHTGDEAQIEAMVEKAVAEFGQVDVLVNNAAANPYFGPMLDLEWRAWDKTFEVNVKGYFATARAVSKHLLARGAGGSIVQIASVLGVMAAPMQGIYGMTKAAVISMTKTLSAELGPRGIRVNAIAPGLVDTKFAAALTTNDALREMIVARTTVKRVGAPADVSSAVAFLASDASSYVSGTVITVDGGWSIT